jgi:hypothetical protein
VSSVPAAAFDSMVNMIAWKFSIHGVDAHGRTTETAGSGSRFATGQRVTIDTIVGHRDVGNTVCPGRALYPRMAEMRDRVKARAGAAATEGGSTPVDDGAEAPDDGTGTSDDVSTYAPFVDTVGNVHQEAIERLRASGITIGCDPDGNLFCPKPEVSRGQMASFVFRAMGDLDPVTTQQFPDVPPDHAHFGAINALKVAGVIEPLPDGTYEPNEPLDRAGMAMMLREALGLEFVWGQMFSDVPMGDPAYDRVRPRINAIAQEGITLGCGQDRYCPWENVTRQQMASFLVRAFVD